jgi:pentachlorophenol monooxygenase
MTDVLVVGAGPVGLTAGIELRRRGITARVVDRLEEPPQYAKAVGIQPRTLEVWEDMGVAGTMLDASTPLEGQIVYVNGAEVARMTFELPPDVPYGFVGLPQYETERLLAEHLATLGTVVERDVELRSFEQDGDGVSAVLAGPAREETVRCRYLVGCDGAHSTVRKQLGAAFEGGRFAEEYMLGDVEVDWSLPRMYGIRAMHRTEDGATDDLLVCIPLPGRGRYRMSMLVPPDLAGSDADHGFASDRPSPTLAHVQAVLDRLAPERTTARNLRWSSVFRISHRLVDRYSDGRVFLCGDAAHIHPPTGAQGMNTGIQDAYNLG